jgi:hypothetical protein
MADIGTLTPEQMLQQQQILRQQKMAEMLMQQGMQQPQGQMVSGRYVAPSFAQNIAGLANVYFGQRGIDKANQAQIDLAKQLRADETSAMADFLQQKQGKPAEMYPAQAGPMLTGGNIPLQESAPAVAPNPQAAYANLYANPKASAAQRNLAFTKMSADPEEFTMSEGQKRFVKMPDGTVKEVASGGDKLSNDYRDYLLAQKDPINPFRGGFTDYQISLKKAGASNINMPSEGERKAGFMSNILDRNILQMQTALGVDPKAIKPNVAASVVESVTGPNLLSRSMKPAQRQIVEDSQLDVLDAALTLRTGAAYTREQLNAMRDTYFPVLGDKPQAISAKKQRLETLLEGAYIASGRATPQRVSAPPPAPVPTPNNSIAGNAQQTNLPKLTGPKFLGFEPTPTGQ